MRSFAVPACGVVSVLSMAAGLFACLFLILSPSGGGFFPDLDTVLGLLALCAGTIVSGVCNAACWSLDQGRRWLGGLALMQVILALGVVAVLLQT
ncbi:hypothetical protein [Pararhizobium sp.]|uniref:hypothetical protein n=1 Tax=Pararhizobium sp. TaxID=1977563 RepID=UPI002726BD0A|nr:hypothetical protein [Pararhizobium sp.]MDO9416332.1 hypothetical protein [Pararhizobium sp.]